MTFPIVDLNTPTTLVLEWGWLLVTKATFVVFVLLVVVFVVGATVREPGMRRALARARAERDAAAGASERTEEEGR